MARPKSTPARKTYGLRLDQALMKDLQYLGIDEDQWVNDLVEEAIRDLLKKYKDKRKESR